MPVQLHDTVFPTASDKDIAMQIRMLEERYDRLYPEVHYYEMNLGSPTDQEGDVPATPPPATVTEIDDLWGEPVATGEQSGLAWENPHSGALDATEGDKRIDRGLIHTRIDPEPSEKTLSRYGIDEKRVIVCEFLVSQLQAAGITVHHGDRFFWKTHVMEVRKWFRTGYWRATSYHLYIELAAVYARYGS